jgi:hypothetical protein
MALGVLSGNLPLLFADCGGRVVEGCAVTQDLFDLIGPFGGKNGQDIYIKSLTQQFLEELHKCKRRSASTTGVGLCGNASSARICETAMWLFRQADLFAKSRHSRIAAKQSKFRGVEGLAYPCSTESSHAIQGLQRAIFVTQAGIDERL